MTVDSGTPRKYIADIIEVVRDLDDLVDAVSETYRLERLADKERLAELERQLAVSEAARQEAVRDANRWQHSLKWGFPVRNQTPHAPEFTWAAPVDVRMFYGETPDAAMDAAIKAGESSDNRENHRCDHCGNYTCPQHQNEWQRSEGGGKA